MTELVLRVCRKVVLLAGAGACRAGDLNIHGLLSGEVASGVGMRGIGAANTDPIVGHPIARTARYIRATLSRDTAYALVVIVVLSLTPILVAHADENRANEGPTSDHYNRFGQAVKRDAKAVRAAFKEGTHRVKVASKAVAHEIATAAKRGASETRAAFRGEKSGPAK